MEFQLNPVKQSGNEQNDKTDPITPISSFRRFLPQVLAGTAKNLLLYDLGTIIGFQTILIANVLNAKTELSFNADQASWFASLLFIGQIVGSLLGGVLLELLGRKKSMILLNIPLLIGWMIICSEYSVTVYYAASIILGLALGCLEVPAITYIGEISEPKIRGVLTSYSELSASFGILTVYILGVYLKWQTVAYICTSLPIISALAISQIPESPIWLLAYGQTEEAVKALCWLRGWVKPKYIEEEFSQLVSYKKTSIAHDENCPEVNHVYENKVDLKDEKKKQQREDLAKEDEDTDYSSDGSVDLYKHRFYSIDLGHRKSVIKENIVVNNLENEHKKYNNTKLNNITIQNVLPNKEIGKQLKDKENKFVNYVNRFINCILDLSRPKLLRPLLLMSGFFFFLSASGYGAVRPFAIPVFKELGFAVEPFKAAAVTILALCLGKITLMLLVRSVGKRFLVLLSSIGCGSTCIALGIYALPIDKTTYSSWIPVIIYLIHVYCFGLGLGPVPWMYLSEVFPFRGRTAAAGLSAAICYMFGFLVTNTFMTVKLVLTLPGSFFVYGSISLLGFVFIYFFLPETEGKTLQDIETNHFNKNKS